MPATALLYPLPKRTTVLADGPKTATHSGCYYAGRNKTPRVIVIHAMQTGETATTAEAVGAWFQDPKAEGSAHKGADTDSLCLYVHDEDTAWGAPKVNADGLHMEHAGKSEQTATQWRDDPSLRILENGAVGVAEWCIKYTIPARWLTNAQLGDGVSKGLATHKQCSDVFGGTHWDPGTGFPKDYYLSRVKFHIARLTPVPSGEIMADQQTVTEFFTGYPVMKNPLDPDGPRVAPSFVIELAAKTGLDNTAKIDALTKAVAALAAKSGI